MNDYPSARTSIRFSGKTPDEMLENLIATDHKTLAMQVLNDRLNDLVREHNHRAMSDKEGDGEPTFQFMGWFWRNVNWLEPGDFAIAASGDEVRVCQNNKWGYPQRELTSAELATVRGHVWDALTADGKGGVLAEIYDEVDRHLEAASTFIANLDVPWEDA